MTLDPAEEMIICVNGSEEMKHNETAMAGQLWIQGDRMMTASNSPFDGMANTKEAAILSGVAEAVAWKNEALEPEDPPRKGQRVVIYPKDLVQLDAVLSTGNPNVDSTSGHPIAYERILAHAHTFENPPIFIKADADRITTDPKLSELVPSWMCTAERIATASRRRVPEDGPDTWNSDDEAKEDVEPDKELGACTPEMDPTQGPKVLSQQEAARQRAAANALSRSQSSGFSTSTSDVSSDFGNSIISSRVSSQQPTQQPSPPHSDADGGLSELKRVVDHAKECLARHPPRPTSAPGTRPSTKKKPEEAGNTGTRSRAVPDPTPPTQASESKKAVASPGAPADQLKGTKVPPPTKGQQVPKHPMETRKQANDGSRAGGFRPGVGGSGLTDTCVASSHPSQT
jgi:hypothetical protein